MGNKLTALPHPLEKFGGGATGQGMDTKEREMEAGKRKEGRGRNKAPLPALLSRHFQHCQGAT